MTIVTSDILETGGARAKDHGIPVGAAVKVWMRIASLSFGGPACQIAVMHRILVDEKRWIGEERFLHALNYCMLLPGPGGAGALKSGQGSASGMGPQCPTIRHSLPAAVDPRSVVYWQRLERWLPPKPVVDKCLTM